MENFQSVENARAYLREQGYFVDNKSSHGSSSCNSNWKEY